MVVTKQTVKDEISKRLGLKGMGNYDSFIKSTPANAKIVQAEAGAGSVAPIGNKVSKVQSAADFKAKTGIGEEPESPRDVLEVTKSIMNIGKDTKHHDEDVDNLIYAIGSYFPTEAIAKAVPLLKGLISKLGSKTFKPEAVEAAIEKGFKSHRVGNGVRPGTASNQVIENFTTSPAYKRKMFNAYDTEIIYKPNDPEVLTEMKRLNKNIDRYDINGVIDKMTPESTAQYLNEKAAHKARRSYLRDYSDGGRYSNVGEYNPARAIKEEATNIRDYINDIEAKRLMNERNVAQQNSKRAVGQYADELDAIRKDFGFRNNKPSGFTSHKIDGPEGIIQSDDIIKQTYDSVAPAYARKYPERVTPDYGRIMKSKEEVYDDMFGKHNWVETNDGRVYGTDYIDNRNYYDDVNVKEYLHGDKDIPND